MEKSRKAIAELDGRYFITAEGEVYGPRKTSPLKQKYKPEGYKWITVRNNGKSKNLYIHRLVAKAFIPNPENKAQVNHIDGNKANNKVENLEWVNAEENGVHRFYKLRKTNGCYRAKPVYCKELDKSFISVGDAGRKLGISPNCIAKVARGNTKNKTAGGFHWEYKTKKGKIDLCQEKLTV